MTTFMPPILIAFSWNIFRIAPISTRRSEAQFRIGEMYLSGKKIKLLGIPFSNSMDHAIEIFAAIVRTAPFWQIYGTSPI
jgi:hypothetical protein